MTIDSVNNWSARALAAERELTIERAHRSKVLGELKDSIEWLTAHWQASTERPFGPSPLECLRYVESLEDGPEKQYLWARNKEILEVGLRERQWRETKAEAARVEASSKPAPDSLSAEYERLQQTDVTAARAFYEKNKQAILLEHENKRLHIETL